MRSHPPEERDDLRSNLLADCGNCFGLCCVALAFSVSADFAIDKDSGQPCPNLQTDYRCGIHRDLRARGFPGCSVYDCFGAGQKVSQITFDAQSWRRDRATADLMFAVFAIMRQLHEMMWYLTEALTLPGASPYRDELEHTLAATEEITRQGPGALARFDVPSHRKTVTDLLARTSELVRAHLTHRKTYRGADLIGARLVGADLRGADLRGAYLIGADLRHADLRGADLIGVDLRDANLSGADLTGSLFLTQSQINSARGDLNTRLPSAVGIPSHWLKVASTGRGRPDQPASEPDHQRSAPHQAPEPDQPGSASAPEWRSASTSTVNPGGSVRPRRRRRP